MKDGVKVDPYEVKCDFTGASGISTGLLTNNKILRWYIIKPV